MIGNLRGVRGAAPQVPRPVRLVAQTVILATIVSGTTAFTTLHKSVTLEVNGDVRTVSVFGRTVDDVLAGQVVDLSANDKIYPEGSTIVNDGDLIVVRTLKDIQIEIDGEMQTIASTALTVGEVLDELGPRTEGATVSASRSEAVGRSTLKISTVKNLTVSIDGQLIERSTTAASVRDVLSDLGVVLSPGDVVSPELETTPVDGQVITVGRVAASTTTETEVLPFTVEETEDASIVVGQRVVKQTGRVGQAVTTYDIALVDGVESERTVVARQVIVAPRDELVSIGTLELPDPTTVVIDSGSARALGQSMALERGYGADEFACLESLWTKESNWNVTAENASSGAYGIPQSLPGSKMASVASDWRTNAATQITWGLNYIEGRYGTPCGAWAHSQSSGWY
ncbi:ubiquitin-like domain-containing protein [Sanguibacter antarcticus]|uniref:aggregation-promoting factor C-terminal-like domain-containing protein n=1 Tax=Sanguibacter antarcticus TaxID=372484 RepID=UPI001FE52B92|nr:ubiquitin-like domain-containing protein [Sanguibacter antarcticus]